MALTTAPAIDYALPRQQDEGDHWIDDWRPEDPVFWETIGRPIARRNLIFSIFAEHVGFSVWMLWSIVVVFRPRGTVRSRRAASCRTARPLRGSRGCRRAWSRG